MGKVTKEDEQRKIELLKKHADYLLEMTMMSDEMNTDWVRYGAPQLDRCPTCNKVNFDDDEVTYYRNRTSAIKDKSREIARKFLSGVYRGDVKKVDEHINKYARENKNYNMIRD